MTKTPSPHGWSRSRQVAKTASRSAPAPAAALQNPPNAKAWELIDAAGCRGLTRGGAQVSNQHCNFLINTGEATADDLEGLGEDVRRRVKETTGVELEWEIRRIGVSGRPTEGRAS